MIRIERIQIQDPKLKGASTSWINKIQGLDYIELVCRSSW